MESNFYILFWNMLVSTAPIDTGNLKNHIKLELYNGNDYRITIEAPLNENVKYNGKPTAYDYAWDTNYKNRTSMLWIERSLIQTANLIAATNGGVVRNEL